MKIEKNIHEYDDIIRLPHPVSRKHPPMSPENRAAQFSPFAALTGYEDLIDETARFVDRKIEPDEGEKAELDRKLNLIGSRIGEEPEVTLSRFIPDVSKSGGRYELISGAVKKIDPTEAVILMTSGERIPLDDVLSIEIR